MTEGSSSLSASLEALHALGVVRAATWFDDDGYAVEFAVLFQGKPRSQTVELQDGLKNLARAAFERAVPTEGHVFDHGRVSADIETRTVSVDFVRSIDQLKAERAVVDFVSPASLFERSVEPADDVADDPGPWDLRWEVEDEIDVGGWLVGERTSDPEVDDDTATPVAFDKGAAERADRVREQEAVAALDEALSALSATGAVTAIVRYSVKDFVQGFSDAMNTAVAADALDEQSQDELVGSIGEAFGELAVDEGALDFESFALDGRGLAETEPAVPWLQAVALIVVLARFGEPGDLWAMSGAPGVLELDLERKIGTIAYQRPSRRVEVDHVALHAVDDG
jgi:hypothetical protein